MKAIYKGGQFQTGDFAQILTGIYSPVSLNGTRRLNPSVIP